MPGETPVPLFSRRNIMKYIQNTYTSGIEVNIKPAAGGRPFAVHFERYKVDRLTGQVISDGYTEVEDDLFRQLEGNGAFRMCRDKGWLVVHSEAPLKAGSFEQMLELKARVAEFKEENAELKEENAELRAKLAERDSAPVAAPAVPDAPEALGYGSMSYNELKAAAREKGIKDIPAKKVDLIAALEAADKEM